tara:strand:- start:5449 stop:6144 length:696 start_codon:yes stop_codon:yes gene_type:complete
VDPLDHFIWLGHRLGRNPGPDFDASAYRAHNQDVARSGYNPLLQYLRYGKAEGREAEKVRTRQAGAGTDLTLFPRMERTPGYALRKAGNPTVLVAAHVAGRELFGSERSLIDMLDGLAAMGCNLIVTIPNKTSGPYLERLKSLALAVISLPYGWWRDGSTVDETAVAGFSHIIAQERVDILHANMIILREPLMAARRIGIPAVVHARELILHDEALLSLIGEDAKTIIKTV